MESDKPMALQVLLQNIPLELRQIPRWTLWKYLLVGEGDKKRYTKVPLQPSGNPASSSNKSTWVDFHAAEAAYKTGGFDGVGFVFTDEDNLVGIDLDDVYSEQTGLTPFAQSIVDKVQGYVEISPSNTGVKIFTRANVQVSHVDHSIGLEVYGRGRYFTVTGNHLKGTIPTQEQDLTGIIPERTIKSSGDAFETYNPPLDEYDLHRVETEILAHLDPNMGYDDWLRVGMALHHQFRGDYEALELWDRWSDSDGNCLEYTPGLCDKKWDTFRDGGTTIRSLIFNINKEKKDEALARGEVILGNEPVPNAQSFLHAEYASPEGTNLVHYADDFYQHKGTHYDLIEEATVRSHLYKYFSRCKKQDKKGNIVPFSPNPANVSAALDAIKAIVHLQNDANAKPPVWLDGYAATRPTANKLVSLKNGLFHLEDAILLPHSLGFFTVNSLPFAYDPAAKCPQWNRFLSDLWEDDQESIDTLQEMFGYILSGDTSQQKFFNLIGPRRSGKGTINKILVDLLGQHNTVAPQMEELCDTFGLQPWLGKLLASFTDARAPERNRSAVVSQLLRIVGGDTVTVNRKNRESWNGYLPTRIVMYSNEVLQLTENSNALTGRMIVLKMNKSFYGKEDTALSTRLQAELSGIFNWAMEGLRRRLERGGYFIQPESGKQLLETMEELSNPIGTFIDDALVFDGGGVVRKDHLFTCFKRWSVKHGLHPGNELSFKRRFLAATQDHNIQSTRSTGDGGRRPIYQGIRLNSEAQAYIDKQAFFDLEEGSF
jgi:P4 family phage/plasmid primase-like protien